MAALTSRRTAEDPVRVVVAGTPEDRTRIAALVGELLGPLDPPLDLQERDSLSLRNVLWPGRVAPAAAFVWVDLTGPEGAAVYVADAQRDRVLVRPVPFESLDEASREQIGQIVRGSVEALLEGAQIGITRAEAAEALGVTAPEPEPEPEPTPEPEPPEPEPEPTPEPEPEPQPGPSIAAAVGGGYRVQPWSVGRAPIHGPAATAFAWWDGPLLLGGGLTVAGALPQRFTLGAIDVAVAGADVIGWWSLGGFLSRRVAIHAEFGGGVSLLRVISQSDVPDAEVPAPTTTAQPALAAQLGPSLWFRAGRNHVVASVRVGAQAEAVDLQFVADGGAFTFDPWRIRPTAELSVAFGYAPRRR